MHFVRRVCISDLLQNHFFCKSFRVFLFANTTWNSLFVCWFVCECVLVCVPHSGSFEMAPELKSLVFLSYDSNMNDSRDNKKNTFSSTMGFVEEYLNNVLNDDFPFANEEKNKLTYEVRQHPPKTTDIYCMALL